MDEYQERVRRECEELGEEKVKENIGLGRYSGKHLRYVEAWRAKKSDGQAQSDRDRSDASSAEHIRIARSAKNAAWAAAIAAIMAAICAAVAIVITWPT